MAAERRPLHRLRRFLAVGTLPLSMAGLAAGRSLAARRGAHSASWWMRDPPTMAQVDTASDARAYAARSAMHGAGDDPTWGLLAARLSYDDQAEHAKALKRLGIPAITWVEGFGDCTVYAAALATDVRGVVARDPRDTTVPRVLLNHWGWQGLPGLGPHRLVWMGPEAYFDDAPWARPYTRTNPRYGAPVPRYPDGRPAVGFLGDPANPVHARLFDAGGSKDLNGRLRPEWSVNAVANATMQFPRAGSVPLVIGRDEIGGPPPGRPGSTVYGTHASIHKDAACPFWLDYAAASYRQIADLGIDGLWCDNFSAWDNFGYPPIEKSFGDWSVARFAREASRWGLARAGAAYDIRADLKARFRQFFPKRDPSRLDDPGWRDPRWLDDPAWRAYRTFKRRVGAEALAGLSSRLRSAFHDAGRAEAPLLSGNDVPLYALGWVRPGYLGMVNTELSPGWHMGTGSFGTGFLPDGRLSPIYRLAVEHASAPYAIAWLYLEGEYAPYRTRPAVFRAAAAEAMLGRTLLLGYDSSGRTAGTAPEHAAWNRYVARMAPLWRGRLPAPEAAVLWSPSSQLAYMAPGGYPDMDAQAHAFGHYGWATFLEEAHVPYRPLPEFSVTAGTLSGVRLLILPDVECMTGALARTLRAWTRRGGTLVVTGDTGVRAGEDAADHRRPVSAFPEIDGARRRGAIERWPLGQGRLVVVPGDPGMEYYVRRRERATLFPHMQAILGTWKSDLRLAAPKTVGISMYRAPDGTVQVDLANLDLDRAADAIRPTRDLTLVMRVPASWRARTIRVTARPIGLPVAPLPVRVGTGRLTVLLGRLDDFETVSIGPAGSALPQRSTGLPESPGSRRSSRRVE